VTPRRLEIHIAQDRDFKYTTTFYGSEGRPLRTTAENPAVYGLDHATSYVRAEVANSRGDVAWVQPVFVREY
ncbi:MAG: hypothetical protein HKO77_08780, partial [Gemmatimonadetes bacterium]|nr:hypothetical protein [Gemmatimonadota bacterium]